MPMFDFSGQGAQKGGGGFSLNPITDAQKVTSGLGDWINQHTGIGSFNPGIGSAVSTIGGIIPGLANLGIAAATPWNETSQNRLGQAATGFEHGLADTATDVATLGGLAPYTGGVENFEQTQLGYHPSTLKQYATQKGGPGLLGAGLNDFANLAGGAGIYAKSAMAGELGEAAVGAQAADRAAQLATASSGSLPGDVAAAGADARLSSASEAANSANFAPEDVLGRAKLLDRLNTVRQGAEYAFNPLRAWQALGAPLGRAAVLAAVPEAGIDTEAGRLAHEAAPVAQEATQAVSEPVAGEPPVAAPQAAPVPAPESELERLAREASEAEAAKVQGAPALSDQPAPGTVRLYRGQPLDPNVPVGTDNWTSTLAEAQSHAAASGGQVLATDVPAAVAEQAHAAAQQAGDFGTNNTVHHLPPEYADTARPLGNPDIAPTLYHGTSTAWEGDAAQLSHDQGSGARNLFGPGVYATGDEAVARSYMEKGKGTSPSMYEIQHSGTPKLIDAEARIADDLKPVLRNVAQGNPDLLHAIENGTFSDFYKAYRSALADQGLPRSEADSATFDLNHTISQAGYDGIRYQGGLRTGGAAHEAFMFFAGDPEQLGRLSINAQAGDVLTKAPPVAASPAVEEYRRARDLGPQEKQINLARAKETPDWATKIVEHLPEPAKKLLRAMEYRAQGHQTATVINEAGRTQRMATAAEMREPWFKAHVALAQTLIGEADAMDSKISPDQADRIVGERVHAAMTAGPIWHQMEELRPQLEAIEPQAVEKAFGFRGRMPAELNTPELREQVQGVADLAAEHLQGRAEFAASSPYLGERGMEPQEGVRLTADQEAKLRKAVQMKLDVLDLEPEVRKQAEAAINQIATEQGNAGAAADTMAGARAAAAEAMQRLIEKRYGPRIFEDEHGVPQPGREANANLSAKQMAATGTGLPGDTPQEAYQRGLEARKALEDYQAAQAKEAEGYANMLEAHRNVVALQSQLANASLPAQMTSAALHGKSETLLTRLQDELNNASVSRVPPVYQPAVRAALEIARMVKDQPELGDVLAEVPQSFATAVKALHDAGFDPTHISEMTEERARRFAMGTSILSPDLGKQEVGLFRKQRTGALASAGLDSRTAAGMAAQWASALHEDRVNAIADHVDRLYAIPAPKNEFGERYNPNQRELTWWDQRRRGLLSTGRPESGIEQGIQGQYLIPKSVARVLDAYSKDHSNMLQRALAKVTNPWRALVLTASPKFYVNHMIGHVILGAVQGVSLKQWAEAWGEAKSGFANYPELAKQGIYEREAGMPSSMIPYKDMAQARAADGFVGAVREGQSHLNNAVNTVDSFAKAALAIRGEAKGLTREDALHFAQMAGVDYGALSPFERQVVRSVIPFYSFEKGVLKIVMQYPLDHPVAANLLMQTGRLQQHWAVDSQGNPLPSAYQDIIKIPGLGNVNFKNLTPFKDVSSLVTVGGLVNSLQFAVKAGIESGLGVAPPGVKAGVKVGPTGNLVPDVPLLPTLANSLDATPQGALIGGGSPLAFAGVPTVSQTTLDNAGQKNAVATGETQLPLGQQQQATAFPVDSSQLQNQLAAQVNAGGPSPSPVVPQAGTTPSPDQVATAVKAAVARTRARAAATRATKSSAPTIKKPRKQALRQKVGKAANRARKPRVKKIKV